MHVSLLLELQVRGDGGAAAAEPSGMHRGHLGTERPCRAATSERSARRSQHRLGRAARGTRLGLGTS